MHITIHRDGQNHGPYTLEQVKEYLGNGSLIESDLAWQEGCKDWLPLRDIITPVTTPPPPPPPKLPPPAPQLTPEGTSKMSQKQSAIPLKVEGASIKSYVVAGLIVVVIVVIGFLTFCSFITQGNEAQGVFSKIAEPAQGN